jgi:uncharacterized membrane protein YqhA
MKKFVLKKKVEKVIKAILIINFLMIIFTADSDLSLELFIIMTLNTISMFTCSHLLSKYTHTFDYNK